MSTIDTKLPQLILNKLTEAQFRRAKSEGKINPNEVYLTEGGSGIIICSSLSYKNDNILVTPPEDVSIEEGIILSFISPIDINKDNATIVIRDDENNDVNYAMQYITGEYVSNTVSHAGDTLLALIDTEDKIAYILSVTPTGGKIDASNLFEEDVQGIHPSRVIGGAFVDKMSVESSPAPVDSNPQNPNEDLLRNSRIIDIETIAKNGSGQPDLTTISTGGIGQIVWLAKKIKGQGD